MKLKDRHRLHLLCDVSERIALLTVSEDIENFLQHTWLLGTWTPMSAQFVCMMKNTEFVVFCIFR